MADDITLQSSTLATPAAGVVIAADDVSSVFYQKVKLDVGGDGLSSPLVRGGQNSAASLPVVIASDQGAIPTISTVTTVSTVTSLTQMNGAAIAMGTGARSAGTQRVTIATDDVVPASQSGTWNIGTVTTVTGVTTVSTVTSLTQFNGVAIALNTGLRSAGTLRVTIATDDVVPASQSGTWNIGTVTTVTTVSAVTSLTQFNGVAIALNTGLRAAGVLRVTQATDDVVHVDDNSASLSVDWNGTQPVTGSGNATGALRVELANNGTGLISTVSTVTAVTTVSTVTSLTQFNGVAIALNTGTRSTGTLRVTIATDDVVPASQSGTWTVQPGNTPNTTAWLMSLRPATTGGHSTVQFNGDDGAGGVLVATAQVVKGSAGQVYGISIYNPNTAAMFVHLYNTAAASVTVGTTNPLRSWTIPPGSALEREITHGLAFGTAISAAATTTAGGNTAPGTGLDVEVEYT